MLFSEYDYCMNLGGFSKFLSEKKQRVAFDISPVNTVLNHYASILGLIMMIKEKLQERNCYPDL
jgi:anhydro-N-acetylmuramic acid kinase